MAGSKTQAASDQLPTNHEAERAVLGFLLAGGNWPEDLAVRDFSLEVNQILFRAMDAIHLAGETIELPRLKVQLTEKELNYVGIGYLADLVSGGCYREMPIAPYVGKLKEATSKRDVLHLGHILIGHIHSDDRSSLELLDIAGAALEKLRERGPQPAPAGAPGWPEEMREAAFYGVAGDLVRRIGPHTESDPAALLLQLLISWGSLAGRGPYYLAEADRHHTNEFAVIVGTSSKARKGTSYGRIMAPLRAVDETWADTRQVPGLGSGEALADAVDVEDKRVLVQEGELARLLAVIGREGSTVSSILRTAWDHGTMAVATRAKKVNVQGAHISLLGHITRDELLRRLSETEMGNGFGNRILWACARRTKLLPHGGGEIDFGDVIYRLKVATDCTRRMGNTRVRFNREAAAVWEREYAGLSDARPGMLGSMTSRAEAHVVRLSLIYALLDAATEIGPQHLAAALAVWRYCFDSARFIWGDALGDPVADEVLRSLAGAGGEGMTRWEVSDRFSGHKKASELDRALGMLEERGLIRSVNENTNGRRLTRYRKL